MAKQERGIHGLYNNDPQLADELIWGRKACPKSRRGFLKDSGKALMSMVLGAPMVFADYFPSGLIPAALAHSDHPFHIPGKHPGLLILNDRPLNAETPPHLLDDLITPASTFFVRNNGLPPAYDAIDPSKWLLQIGGESVKRKKSFTIQELKSKFKTYSYQLTIECGGNGRKEFNPPAKGNQWSLGAVGCAKWTGVRLRDVLKDVGLQADAVYVGYYGKDTHLSGDQEKVVISRGIPMAKAMEDESLIAWSMNDVSIPLQNGYPLRMAIGGWPGSVSGKWLSRLVVRDRVHDGSKMGGQSYRVPCNPVAPGTKVPDEEMCIIESMPVKSLITYPKSGAMLPLHKSLNIRGHAWAGDLAVEEMSYSIDFGQHWHRCRLEAGANRLAWQHFSAQVTFPKKGYYEVWARATDTKGRQQPILLPGWNPKGYLNNACHRIAIKVI